MSDEREEVDHRISREVARWTGTPFFLMPYTRDLPSANRLRELLEEGGRRPAGVRAVTLDREPAFIYVCIGDGGDPFAQGVGPTPALAICDAFLLCCPESS